MQSSLAMSQQVVDQRLEGLETRLVLKLGALMTGLFALAGALLELVRYKGLSRALKPLQGLPAPPHSASPVTPGCGPAMRPSRGPI